MSGPSWRRETGSLDRRTESDLAGYATSSDKISQIHLLHREHGGQNVIDARKDTSSPAITKYIVDSITGKDKSDFLKTIQFDKLKPYIGI